MRGSAFAGGATFARRAAVPAPWHPRVGGAKFFVGARTGGPHDGHRAGTDAQDRDAGRECGTLGLRAAGSAGGSCRRGPSRGGASGRRAPRLRVARARAPGLARAVTARGTGLPFVRRSRRGVRARAPRRAGRPDGSAADGGAPGRNRRARDSRSGWLVCSHGTTARTDRSAISYHYDVGNAFYRLWLDERMVYSCAYFRTGEETLDEAQCAKLDHICRKLRLAPGERLLDVGCGWGGLVIHAAQHYGVSAVGITLSKEQHALARERVAEHGLADRVRRRTARLPRTRSSATAARASTRRRASACSSTWA